MRTLHDLPMRPRYLVAGQTHPKVLASHGESYRRDRMEQAGRHGISSSVTFDADYRDVQSLTALIQSSKVVVLPYDSKDQVTSGVLVDAIAAGRPVVATAFPHAVELLSSGAGIVVDHDDPDAMALALRRILTRPELAANMAAEASRLGTQPRVAGDRGRVPETDRSPSSQSDSHWYEFVAARLPEPDFGHLIAMTDERGTFEHALFAQPRPEHGYCSDDMARVLVVAAREPDHVPEMRSLAMLCLRFLQDALDSQGRCRNRMNRFGAWEDSPAVEDSWGRTIWGLGTAVSRSDDHLIRNLAGRGLERAMTQRSPWPRAMAFAALGAAEVLQVDPGNSTARALLSDAADTMTRAPSTWPVALARGAPDLCERDSPRGNDRGRLRARASSPHGARIGALGVAARPGDS